MNLHDIIKPVTTVSPETTFQSAVQTMVAEETNVLLVIDEAEKLIGLVSVTDLLDAVVPEYLDGDSTAAHFASSELFTKAISDTKNRLVKDFMSRDLTTVTETESLMSVAVTAINSKRLRIPVVDHNCRPIGLISRQSLKHIIAEHLNSTNSA